jgi:hypothetical protein
MRIVVYKIIVLIYSGNFSFIYHFQSSIGWHFDNNRSLIITNSMELGLSWELPVTQPFEKFPTFYRTWRIITTFTRTLHWSLSWAISIQCIPPQPIALRPILILSCHLCLGLSSHLIPADCLIKILYAFLFTPTHSACLVHYCIIYIYSPWFDHSNFTWHKVKVKMRI